MHELVLGGQARTVIGCSPAQAAASPRAYRDRGLCEEGGCNGSPTLHMPPKWAYSLEESDWREKI